MASAVISSKVPSKQNHPWQNQYGNLWGYELQLASQCRRAGVYVCETGKVLLCMYVHESERVYLLLRLRGVLSSV